MEDIRQAVELARTSTHPVRLGKRASAPRPRAEQAIPVEGADGGDIKEVELNAAALVAERIVAHDATDPRTKAYDLLRTQILRSMDLKGWQVLAVTSPAAGCGKTLTSINLALSIARRRERPVLLIDADLTRPQVANRLGFRCEEHLLGVLEGRTPLSKALIQARFLDNRLMVLGAKPMLSSSAEWLASRTMAGLLQQIKKDYPSAIIILDLPPMLAGDDVMAILPQIDNILLVAEAGTSTIAQVEDCSRHLQSVEVRIVLNKSKEPLERDYAY